MSYLLDADSLITPKNSYYSMELCPRFWSWLIEANKGGKIFSIQKVKEELLAGKDELSDWVKQRGGDFFLPPTEQTLDAYTRVCRVVQQNQYFTEANRSAFYSKADSWLIAHALACGYTVVTFEKAVPPNSSKIKIPSVCSLVGVPTTDIVALMRQFKVRLA